MTISAFCAALTSFFFDLFSISRKKNLTQKRRIASDRPLSQPLHDPTQIPRGSFEIPIAPVSEESSWNQQFTELRALLQSIRESASECNRATAFVEYLRDEIPDSILPRNGPIPELLEDSLRKRDELISKMKKRETRDELRFSILSLRSQLDKMEKQLEFERNEHDIMKSILPLSLIHTTPRFPMSNEEILEYSGFIPSETRYKRESWVPSRSNLMDWIKFQCEAKEFGELSFQKQMLLENAGFRWDPRSEDVSLKEIINGILVGLVAISACGNVIEDYWAIIIGISSVLFYKFGQAIIRWLQVEDALYAFPVHGMGGLCGGLFSSVATLGNPEARKERFMAAFGHDCIGNFWNQLAMQAVGLVSIIAFTTTFCSVMYFVLWVTGYLAVDKDGFKTWINERWRKKEQNPESKSLIQERQALLGGYRTFENEN